MCMKRTNLVLDEELLEETKRVSGRPTYSAAVEDAMRHFVRQARARAILELRGSGAWDGDLAVLREDRPPYGRRRR